MEKKNVFNTQYKNLIIKIANKLKINPNIITITGSHNYYRGTESYVRVYFNKGTALRTFVIESNEYNKLTTMG